MNATELIARVRRAAFIPTTHPTYIDQIILDELNDSLRSIYEDLVTIPRQGHWLQQYTFTSVVGTSNYRIIPRAVVGGIEKVEIGIAGGSLYALDQVTENHAQYYESFGGTTGVPLYYVIRGDQLDFLPTFNSAMTVRVTYYIRPSLLVPAQSVIVNNRGRITGITPGTGTITFLDSSSIPTYQTGPLAGQFINTQTGTFAQIDVIHPNGTFELSLVGVQVTNGLTASITVPTTTDFSNVALGDFVRGANETDWPPLPEEFHRCVADTAAVKIMLQLNMTAKAGALAQSVAGDIERLRKLIEAPRTRRQPKRIGARLMTRGYVPTGRWR